MTREEKIEILKDIIAGEFIHPQVRKEVGEWAIKALEQEPCEDAISRKSIKQKLQEHHDFFVNAYGGFSNLPLNDKSRVDEITNCIAMVVNEPPVTPQEPRKGKWTIISNITPCMNCTICGSTFTLIQGGDKMHYCPNCGADMRGEET